MIQRTALFIASLVAALVLAVGLVVAGIGPAPTPAEPVAAAPDTALVDPLPQPTIQVDTVYLTPKVKPNVVTVHKTAPAAPRGDDGENEGDDD